jgi:hypothetical protein
VELIRFENECFFVDGNIIIKKFNPNVMQGDQILLKGTSGGMIWK